jgi:hypothetical protein
MSTTNVKTVIAGTLTACAIAVVGLATAPAATAATTPAAVGRHAYNPNAPRGSVDNPILLKGGSPLLTEAQRKALDQAKGQLESGKGRAKSTAGVQPSALDAPTAVQPDMANNCGDSGFYYCDLVNTTIGWVKMGTILDRNAHENAEAEGMGKNSNSWAVYMDQSRDGGATWTPELRYVVNDTAWSLPIYDGPGYYDRSCLVDNQHGLYYCLPWH